IVLTRFHSFISFSGYSSWSLEKSSFWGHSLNFDRNKLVLGNGRKTHVPIYPVIRAVAKRRKEVPFDNVIQRDKKLVKNEQPKQKRIWRKWGFQYADKVFDETLKDEPRLWDDAIVVILQKGSPLKALQLFRDMQHSFVKASNVTVAKALQACAKVKGVDLGKQIHGYVTRNAMEEDLTVGYSLITMYCKTEEINLARRVFDLMANRDIRTWNSMIFGYASIGSFDDAWNLFYEMESQSLKPDIVTWYGLLSGHFKHGLYQQVLVIFHDMLRANMKPNSFCITPLIQAVTEMKLVDLGKEIHCYVIRNGLDYNEYAGNALLRMYVKTDLLVKAKTVFNLMQKQKKNRKNIFAWNSLISGYSFKGLFGDALATMNQMKASGITPDVVSWTSLISGCSKHRNYKDSFMFFTQMLEEGVQPNIVTYLSLLTSCVGLSLLQTGKEIHCSCLRNGFYEEEAVATNLIDMYATSGCLKCASDVFWRMRNKTVRTWTSMIMGYASYNHGKKAINLFHQMLELGLEPNAKTFTALLSGCKNSCLLDKGWKYFNMMKKDYCLVPMMEHYSCMVDLLGRAGYLDEAWDLIQTMPSLNLKPDGSIWGPLLSSCRTHNELELGKIAAAKLFELEPCNPVNYVMLMDLYSMSNRWADVDRLRDMAFDRRVKINAGGWSWIQIGCKVHHFFNEDDPPPPPYHHHPDLGEIYFELYQLISEMKRAGYVPDINCVYQNIDDSEKEKVLLSHPEKLAITYGLMKTRNSGSPIRVMQKTRMCSDCHRLATFISLVRNREIIVKVGGRFHHFRQGNCSCNDCW
ncbi:hypothetical protein Dimus_016090, partial [Dionaea muscipula]